MMEIKQSLATDTTLIPSFVERIWETVSERTGSQDEAFKVRLALEEALTNAMRHGNRLDPGRRVDVHIEISQEKIVMDVRDQGEGFDHRVLPDPTRAPHVHRASGRGVYLIRSVMDNVEYYDGGRGIRMERHFQES
jgi:serine/threonine-protein kinase RsbW